MFPNNNQIPFGYYPCFNYFAYDHNCGYMGPVPPEHNFYCGNPDMRVSTDFVNRQPNQVPAYTMGIPNLPLAPSYPVAVQPNEPPIVPSCPEPPVEKTEIDIQVENFMREYFIHKAEREAAKAKNKTVTKSQRGRKSKAIKSAAPVVNSIKVNPKEIPPTKMHAARNTNQCNTSQDLTNNVQPGAFQNNKVIGWLDRQQSAIPLRQDQNIPSTSNQIVHNHQVNVVKQQIFYVPKEFHQGQKIGDTMEAQNLQQVEQTPKKFASCLMQSNKPIGISDGPSALDPKKSFALKQEILEENRNDTLSPNPPKKIVFSATRTKVDTPTPSHSSGEDSGRFTIDSKDQGHHLDLDNEMLRNAIQYGPQPRLNKYIFLVDDWISEDYAMEAIDTSNPIVRVSRAKFNWIFVDHPQMSRKFQRCGNSTELDSTVDSQRIEQQDTNVSTQRHKNRITKAIADIEEFITQRTTMGKVHLINRYQAFQYLLRAALGNADSTQSEDV